MFIDSQHKASSWAVSLASRAFIWNSFFLLHEKNPATLLFAFRFFGVGILWILSISEGCTWRFTLVLTLQSTSIKFSYLAFGAALISILLRREYFFTFFTWFVHLMLFEVRALFFSFSNLFSMRTESSFAAMPSYWCNWSLKNLTLFVSSLAYAS